MTPALQAQSVIAGEYIAHYCPPQAVSELHLVVVSRVMGVPPVIIHFNWAGINHPVLGTPILGNPHMYICMCSYKYIYTV